MRSSRRQVLISHVGGVVTLRTGVYSLIFSIFSVYMSSKTYKISFDPDIYSNLCFVVIFNYMPPSYSFACKMS